MEGIQAMDPDSEDEKISYELVGFYKEFIQTNVINLIDRNEKLTPRMKITILGTIFTDLLVNLLNGFFTIEGKANFIKIFLTELKIDWSESKESTQANVINLKEEEVIYENKAPCERDAHD